MNVLGLSDEHEANLRLLAAGGLRIPDDYEKFSMMYFRYNTLSEGVHRYGDASFTADGSPMPDGCGTSACMVGHAPFLGIGKPLEDESWGAYCIRSFGICPRDDEALFGFMFGGSWSVQEITDGEGHHTARACASRILFALEKGLPKGGWLNYRILDAVVDNDWYAEMRERAVYEQVD